MSKRPLLLLAALFLLQLPWLARPVHYDEANFLTLTRGAVADPWRPHDVRINWQGTEQRAFDVLSNPPGIAWWLAPVSHRPVLVQRLWMMWWLPLALFGAWRLGRRFLGDPERGAMVLLTAPIVFLSTPALLPDAPLYALVLAGVGGFVVAVDRERRAWPWALLAGCAVLFRYSALLVPPLLILYTLLRRRSAWPALAGLVPIGLLALHDLHAYGAVHVLVMGGFQSVANTPEDVLHKGVASLAMLGGAAALPLFPWSAAAAVGAVVGGGAGWAWGWTGAAFAALGGAVIGEVVGRALGRGRAGGIRTETEHDEKAHAVGGPASRRLDQAGLRDARWLAAWALGGLLFLLSLRFTATRYWLPFLPAILLAIPTARWTRVFLAVQLGLAVLLAADDDRSARAQEQLADTVAKLGTGVFTGHWGWQWAMEHRGWTPLDEGTRPAAGTLVAMPRQSWPQPVEVNCARVVWEGAARPPLPWIPRGYTENGAANLHANWIFGQPAVRTVAPWTFANDPYERVRVCKD